MFMRKQKPNYVASSMIGALTVLAVGGVLLMSAMCCKPLRNKLMSMKNDAKNAFKTIENEMKQA
ncbi:MAG: hypothetical protein A2Y17_09160 [Clostridiales bacterium GWF2_38_85]|nr:MAG: hypothetical protein A2Y17_09160 [Clostridiales bacterium GWF2_38_85]HBL83634.1 hypothetical protein [Clostridiales bacterium]